MRICLVYRRRSIYNARNFRGMFLQVHVAVFGMDVLTLPTYPGWQSPRTISADPSPAITHPPDCCIVQGLWHPGEGFDSEEAVQRWEKKIVQNVLVPWGQSHHHFRYYRGMSGSELATKLNSIIYAFDEPSYDVLVKSGLSPKPFFDYDRSLCDSSNQQYRRKLLAIRDALDTYRHVLWMDMDCIEMAEVLPEHTREWLPLPTPSYDSFWDVLKAGAEIQAKLRQYHCVKCPWRSECCRRIWIRNSVRVCPRCKRDLSKAVLQGGAFIYARSIPIMDRALEVMATPAEELSPRFYRTGTGRTFDDEMTLGWTVDELNGGWIGKDSYRERGFEAPLYTIRGEANRGDERAIFTAR